MSYGEIHPTNRSVRLVVPSGPLGALNASLKSGRDQEISTDEAGLDDRRAVDSGKVEMKKIDHDAEIWAERHRLEGHHPHPAPTLENPERWDCDCGGICRILTREQTRQKFAHLGAAAKARREGRRLPEDDPAWQERIRRARQRVDEHEQSQNR